MYSKFIEKYKKMSVVAKAAIWFVFCSMLQKCIAFVTVPIFTRIMPTEEYGMYSTYLSWYSIFTVICTLNMHSCVYSNVLAKINDEKERMKKAVSMLSLSGCITLFVFGIYLIFHQYINKIIGLPTALVSLLFAQILFEPPVNFWSMKQRFEYKYVKLVIRTITMVIFNAVLGILFVVLSKENQAIARGFSIVLVQLIFGGAFYIYYYKNAKTFFSTKEWRHYLGVQLPLLPHSLSLTILSSSDRIMINNMVGGVKTAIYSVAYSAGYVVNVLKNSIVDALKPWIYQKIKSKEYNKIQKNVNSIMVLVTLISIIFTAFAPEVIFLMAPHQYYEAIYVIPPVAASSFFTFLYNIFSIVGFYYEKTKRIMVASILGAILNLMLNLICIPIWGYIAAAYTTLICYIFFSVAHFIIMKSICKKYLGNVQIYDIKFILIMSIVVLLMMILFSVTYSYMIVRYSIITIVLIGLSIYRKKFIKIFEEMKKEKNRKRVEQ